MSDEEESNLSPEARALNAIAREIAAYRKEHRKVKPFFGLSTRSMLQDLTGYDPVEARERERGEREREQAKLYRLVVLIAAISAAASIASVAVAALNAG